MTAAYIQSVAPPVHTLAGPPSKLSDLPEPHAEVLALVVAHLNSTEQALPWALLVGYVQTDARQKQPALRLASLLASRGFVRQLSFVVGDLLDYGLLAATPAGLAVTPACKERLDVWNGEFSTLVSRAQMVIDDTFRAAEQLPR